LKIKLYNKTKYDSKPFKKVMEVAYTRLKIRGCAVVKLTRGGTWLAHGVANTGYPYMWSLSVKPLKGKANRYKMEKNSGYGWVTISLPQEVGRGGKTEIDHAEWIYDLIFHELAHIKDFRTGNPRDDTPKRNGRRIAWKARPIEIRAENFSYDAQQKVSKAHKEELVFNLALEIERLTKEIKVKREKKVREFFKGIHPRPLIVEELNEQLASEPGLDEGF